MVRSCASFSAYLPGYPCGHLLLVFLVHRENPIKNEESIFINFFTIAEKLTRGFWKYKLKFKVKWKKLNNSHNASIERTGNPCPPSVPGVPSVPWSPCEAKARKHLSTLTKICPILSKEIVWTRWKNLSTLKVLNIWELIVAFNHL